MTVLKARVIDATHLERSQPIGMKTGKDIYVAVAEEAEDVDRTDFTASKSSLQYAYSDSEPNYAEALLKESNPEYGA